MALVNVRFITILKVWRLSRHQCAIQKLDFLGLFHLFKLFLRYCYEPEDSNQDLFNLAYVPKPNDFSDFSEYFVRKVSFMLLVRLFPTQCVVLELDLCYLSRSL